MPLKIPYLRRCFNFLVASTYHKYASLLGNLAPCIRGILSGIRFQRSLQLHQILGIVLAFSVSGCAFSTQLPATPPAERSGLNQLLTVRSLDRAISGLNLGLFSGQRVHLKVFGLTSDVSYSEALLANELQRRGASVVHSEGEADLKVNAFVQVMGVDHAETFYGVPTIAAPAGIAIPELAFFKSTRDRGYSEIQLYAFDAKTGASLPVPEKGLFGHGKAKYNRYTLLILFRFTLTDVDAR